jgi:UPF0148 protein
MDEEEKLNRITRLLEQGCTMLAAHHDCGAPLFRCKGEIICPICSIVSMDSSGKSIGGKDTPVSTSADENKVSGGSKVEGVADQSSGVGSEQSVDREYRENDRQISNHLSVEPSNLGPAILAKKLSESEHRTEFEITKHALRAAIICRLKNLALDINEEKDLFRLKSQLDCVDAALRVINALK